MVERFASHPLKRVPEGAAQHQTAGPYSPVLEIDAHRLVDISGQVAIDPGRALGERIEEQTAHTLANCARQLATAGCTFADVFKINVYLADIKDWERFNVVYAERMTQPLPVRTAHSGRAKPWVFSSRWKCGQSWR
jgi:2-iminobutanoate/2-iminopropanoate deaminase